MKRKILVGMLCSCFLIGPISAFARNEAELPTINDAEILVGGNEISNENPAHVHTQECYEVIENCMHSHTDACYPERPEGEEQNLEMKEPSACTHICSLESGCITITENLICGEEPTDGSNEDTDSTEEDATSPEGDTDSAEEDVTSSEGDADSSENDEISSEQNESLPTENITPPPVDNEGIPGETVPVYTAVQVQEWMDRLPDAEAMENMSEEERKAVEEEFAEIYAAIALLTEEEKESLDKTKLEEAEQFFIALTEEIETEKENLDEYIIDSITPEHVQVNLFDYWLHGQDVTDNGKIEGVEGTNQDISQWKQAAFFAGINKDHALLFSGGGCNRTFGLFNSWTRSDGAAYEGIVANQLDEDGYPVLNLEKEEVIKVFKVLREEYDVPVEEELLDSKESLAYLFDPHYETDGKESFTGVGGLFQIDEQGNYYYTSAREPSLTEVGHGNFAEFDEESNQFRLYNTWAVSRTNIFGEFFPFNTGAEVFDVKDGKLESQKKADDDDMNHYFGMTLAAQFQQPTNGLISNAAQEKSMQFQFSGDDDVWIFIDGVLVADLGGIHDPMTTTINFETGEIEVKRKDGTGKRVDTTIREQFEKAGKNTDVGFSGNTFADHTVHELKMFYLERGNQDSNLELSFNLLKPTFSEIIKVDQDGKPLEGIGFDLYKADANGDAGEKLADLVTGTDGSVTFTQKDGNGIDQPIVFEDEAYYILRETESMQGYVPTGDIHLQYHAATNVFTVLNKWETGVVDRFKVQVLEAGEVTYTNSQEAVNRKDVLDGLILAVPMHNEAGGKGKDATKGWRPVYGSTLGGFHIIDMDEETYPAYGAACLEAALRQATDMERESWYLNYNAEGHRLEGMLENLPGSNERYAYVNPDDGDFRIVYYLLKNNGIFDAGASAEAKIEALENAVQGSTAEETEQKIQTFIKNHGEEMKLLNVDSFNRLFYSQLHIPNRKQELWVHKTDTAGNSLAGAEFTLYKDKECTEVVERGETDEEGMLIFPRMEEGSYWLKETEAPAGYKINPTVVELLVAEDNIYANAGTETDGVSVDKGVGRLVETMVGFASDDAVNVTLRDIVATKYVCDSSMSGEEITKGIWENSGESLNLHYGLNTSVLDYGVHAEDGETPKTYFETETGWMGIGVKQNYDAHQEDTTKKDDLGEMNLSALFTGTTAVIFEDQKKNRPSSGSDEGNLEVSKIVSGSEGDQEKEFYFTVKLNTSLTGQYGDMKFKEGEAEFTLKHGESKKAVGLPERTRYEVMESNSDGYTVTAKNAVGVIEEDETVRVTLENHKGKPTTPEEPDKPTTPEEPDKPTTPEEPDKPTTPEEPDKPTTSEEPDKPTTPEDTDEWKADAAKAEKITEDVPETGDETNLKLWLTLAGLSCIGIVMTVLKKQYRGKRFRR